MNKQRLYFFVPYNISEIQKGIQAGHAALEYAYLFGNTEEYKQFIENDKTWIILNGGTTNCTFEPDHEFYGSLDQIQDSLMQSNVPYAKFHEPDLNMALSAVCFLADERVWNWEDYPNRRVWEIDKKRAYSLHEDEIPEHSKFDTYEEYINSIGDESILFLKDLLTGKRLA